ncbi:MAG: hypothetical protein IVW53_00580 [Chloroflexi bacterium]|nr:hypothetical protein [Chloroflexota bacterium]
MFGLDIADWLRSPQAAVARGRRDEMIASEWSVTRAKTPDSEIVVKGWAVNEYAYARGLEDRLAGVSAGLARRRRQSVPLGIRGQNRAVRTDGALALASARQRAFGGVTAALQPAVTASHLAAGQTVTIGGAQAPARRSTFRARPPA